MNIKLTVYVDDLSDGTDAALVADAVDKAARDAIREATGTDTQGVFAVIASVTE
jgi:hypothetical protein